MNTQVHFSSAKDECPTPQDFFDKLNAEFAFETDVCATAENAKCLRYFTKEMDGLAQDWKGVCWMNPPYGRKKEGVPGIGAWMKKARESANAGATVVCLVPSRTDTHWWHHHAMKGEIRFIKGRINFVGYPNGAPFPSAVVVFRPNLK